MNHKSRRVHNFQVSANVGDMLAALYDFSGGSAISNSARELFIYESRERQNDLISSLDAL